MREIVYKYRSFKDENHLSLFRKNELFLASPSMLNDPFDIVQSDSFLSHVGIPEFDKQLISLSFNRYNNKNSFTIDEEKIFGTLTSLRKELMSVQKYYFDQTNASINSEKANQILKKLAYCTDRTTKISKKLFQHQYYGILSMSTEIDNLLLWSHYGDNHYGFSIGFYKDMLESDDYFTHYGNVEYSKNYPISLPTGVSNMQEWLKKDAKLEVFLKASEWAYEKEYRLSKVYYPNEPSIEQRIYRFSDDAIAEIVFGAVSHVKLDKLVNELKSVAKSKNIPIYQMVMHDYKFELIKDRRHYP